MSLRQHDGQLSLYDEAPWERAVRGETAKQYAAFAVYRDLGPRRTIDWAWREACAREAAGGRSGPKLTRQRAPSHWKRWAIENRWRERAEAYDAYREKLRREADEARQRELEELRRRFELEQHHKLADLVAKVEDYLDKLLKIPATDLVQTKPDGSVTKVKGLAPAQVARVLGELRATVGQLVTGHKRVSVTGRLEHGGEAGESLLDSVESEILPVDLRLVEAEGVGE